MSQVAPRNEGDCKPYVNILIVWVNLNETFCFLHGSTTTFSDSKNSTDWKTTETELTHFHFQWKIKSLQLSGFFLGVLYVVGWLVDWFGGFINKDE